MPKTPDTTTNDKNDATTPTETQTVVPPANDAPNNIPLPASDKPHRKSNYIMLAPDQASEVTYPVNINGHNGTVVLSARQEQVFHIVPDGSTDPGINQTLADSLLEKKMFVYCDKPTDDAQYETAHPSPETPAGAMLAASTSAAPDYSGISSNSPDYAGYVGDDMNVAQ